MTDAFAGFDDIEGFTPTDKATLVGVPFGITGVRFRTNDNDVMYAEVETVDSNGEFAGFQDSSKSGVRQQLADYLAKQEVKFDDGEWHDVKIRVPNGLRASEYKATTGSGEIVDGITYYLTFAPRKRG